MRRARVRVEQPAAGELGLGRVANGARAGTLPHDGRCRCGRIRPRPHPRDHPHAVALYQLDGKLLWTRPRAQRGAVARRRAIAIVTAVASRASIRNRSLLAAAAAGGSAIAKRTRPRPDRARVRAARSMIVRRVFVSGGAPRWRSLGASVWRCVLPRPRRPRGSPTARTACAPRRRSRDNRRRVGDGERPITVSVNLTRRRNGAADRGQRRASAWRSSRRGRRGRFVDEPTHEEPRDGRRTARSATRPPNREYGSTSSSASRRSRSPSSPVVRTSRRNRCCVQRAIGVADAGQSHDRRHDRHDDRGRLHRVDPAIVVTRSLRQLVAARIAIAAARLEQTTQVAAHVARDEQHRGPCRSCRAPRHDVLCDRRLSRGPPRRRGDDALRTASSIMHRRVDRTGAVPTSVI